MKWVQKIARNELPFFVMLPALVWQMLFLVVPVIIIIWFSFSYNAPTTTFMYYKLLADSEHLRIIGRSLMLAFGTAFTCLLCAYPIAYFLVLYVTRWRNFLLFLLTLPFWTNFLILIYTWFFLLERGGIINSLLLKIGIISEPLHMAHSIGAVFVVMVYCYLPFMIMPIYSTMEKMNVHLLEASADLGATRWQTFKRITLPLSFQGIKTGFALVFIPTFGEIAIPALMGGNRVMTAGSLISHYFIIARDNGLGAAFTVVCSVIIAVIMLVMYGTILMASRSRTVQKSERAW
jgi:spermidine/putrescine transport system permease protein